MLYAASRKNSVIIEFIIVIFIIMSLPIILTSLLWQVYFLTQIVIATPVEIGLSADSRACSKFSLWSQDLHGPFSTGRYNLSYQRPTSQCRTFTSRDVEDTIQRMKGVIKDPDLFRLFENSYPNTL